VFNLPNQLDISNLINDLRILSWEASDILIYYSKEFKERSSNKDLVQFKKNNEPVTLADLKVNDLVISRIKKKYHGIDWHLLSEENGLIKFNNNVKTDWLWILDPLDGTRDFLEQTGNYALHLGLNYKNKPYLGIVLIPEKQELWITNNRKVWCERRDGSQTKIKVSGRKKISEMILVTSKNHNNETLDNIIKIIGFKETKKMGSVGCKISSILRGESDIYISLSLPGKSSPKDWDFSAPEALLRAGGGAITNLDNEDLIYNKKSFLQEGIIIASNDKKNHKNICDHIKSLLIKEKFYPLS
tara:strand:- start:193 stop:1095 length:903 start_codon:yes stop_codon:yes gene_type:complete